MKSVLIIILSLTVLLLAFKNPDKKILNKVSSNDDYNYIAINEILMWVSNNGDGSHDPQTYGNGFYWPDTLIETEYGLERPSDIFKDGLLWGGKVIGADIDSFQVRVNGCSFRQGFQAGKILITGQADDPSLEKYRVYKIRKNWQDLPFDTERDQYQKDYDEWPVGDGAPWMDINHDGIYTPGTDRPKHMGDETLWYVANDLDSSRTKRTYGSLPVGLEQQCTIFAFDRPGAWQNMVFKKYLMINKGSYTIDSMYFSIWSYPDPGGPGQDLVGCDPQLDLAYSYSDANDYRMISPAVGYCILQGPLTRGIATDLAFAFGRWHKTMKNLPMTAFIHYLGSDDFFPDPNSSRPDASLQFYRNMRGMLVFGSPIIDPLTGQQTFFSLSGDPVTQIGWLDGWGTLSGERPGLRRFSCSSGPFKMAPGDSQEIVFSIMIDRGVDNIDSISRLRHLARQAKLFYKNNFIEFSLPEKPVLKVLPLNNGVNLYWEANSEAYDTTLSPYSFEGYRVWQFRDKLGTDPREVAVFDVTNNISVIFDYVRINGVETETAVIKSPDHGLQYAFSADKDIYSQGPLLNGSTYYFAVTAYAHNAQGYPRILESKPEIIEVVPGTGSIQTENFYQANDLIPFEHTTGYGDALAALKVVDPASLNGHTYMYCFEYLYENYLDSLLLNMIDLTSRDTLIARSPINWRNPVSRESFPVYSVANAWTGVMDGFLPVLQNTGKDSLGFLQYAIGKIWEVKGPGGTELPQPFNVDNRLNSSGEWMITSPESYETRWDINWQRAVTINGYEIRFTSEGSEYYLSGYAPGFSGAPLKDDIKAGNSVPFEIWDIGVTPDDPADDLRMIIKIIDKDTLDSTIAITDSSWSHFPADDPYHPNQWEQIFAYLPQDSVYPDVLPEMSGISATYRSHHKIGRIIIEGELPQEGTVIRIDPWRALSTKDTFVVVAQAPVLNDFQQAKKNLDKISVFPNPYFGADVFGRYAGQDYLRFTNLPARMTLRIFSLAGVFVKKIKKDDDSPWLDWDLTNQHDKPVGSGIYIAYLEMPHIGKKVMKLAVIQDKK